MPYTYKSACTRPFPCITKKYARAAGQVRRARAILAGLEIEEKRIKEEYDGGVFEEVEIEKVRALAMEEFDDAQKSLARLKCGGEVQAFSDLLSWIRPYFD